MPAARHPSKLTTPSALPVKPTANILADGYPRRDVLHSGIRLYRLFFPSWYLTRFHSLNHCDGATLGCKSLWEQMAAQGVEDLPGGILAGEDFGQAESMETRIAELLANFNPPRARRRRFT